jgi:hypothetical protein
MVFGFDILRVWKDKALTKPAMMSGRRHNYLLLIADVRISRLCPPHRTVLAVFPHTF